MRIRTDSAFEKLVRAYSADVYRFAYWLSRDASVAEDVVQETFSRVWKAWHQLKDENAVKAWLLTIARNEFNRLFQRKRVDASEDIDDHLELAASYRDPADTLAMQQALAALPLSYKEPLLMQVLGGMSCGEIAAAMELSEGAVMTRLTRARQALRKLWESDTGQVKSYELP